MLRHGVSLIFSCDLEMHHASNQDVAPLEVGVDGPQVALHVR